MEEEKAEEYAKKFLKGFRDYIYLDQAETKIEDAFLAGLHEGQKETDYAKSIIKSLLDNSDEYAEQRARDFLKE